MLLLLGFGAWTAWRAWNTEGFLEADEVLHYLYARYSPSNPTNFVHPWARPLYTALLFPFADAGFQWARMLSVLGGVATAAFAWLTCRALRWKTAACAVPFAFAQPLFFQQTAGIWTEVVFAAVFGAWMLMIVSGRPRTVAVVASYLCLVRPEGFVIGAVTVLLAALGALRDRSGRDFQLAPILIVMLGPLGWCAAGWALTGDPSWVPAHWPPDWAPAASYGRGSWSWLLDTLPAVVPAVLSPLLVAGCFAPGIRRTWPIVLAVVAVVSVHAVLWATGTFGSAGYARYFVTLTPAFAMLVTGGVEVFARFVRSLPPLAWPAAAACVAIAVLLLHSTATVRPPLPPDARLFAALGKWIGTQDRTPALLSVHPFAYLEIDHVPRSRFDEFSRIRGRELRAAAPGTWLLDEDRFYRPGAVASPDPDLEIDPGGSKLEALGWRRITVPDLGVSLAVGDARHDKAIEHMKWSVWRKVP